MRSLPGAFNMSWTALCWIESDFCVSQFLRIIWLPFRGTDFRRIYQWRGKRRGPNGIDYKKFWPFQRTQSHTERQETQCLKDPVMDVVSVSSFQGRYLIYSESLMSSKPAQAITSSLLQDSFHSWLHISSFLFFNLSLLMTVATTEHKLLPTCNRKCSTNNFFRLYAHRSE